MGQQQLLLLVLGIVIVGLAVVVGIDAFAENKTKSLQDAMVNEGVRIASDVQAWSLKPQAFGGPTDGAGFSELENLVPVGYPSQGNYYYTETAVWAPFGGTTADCIVLGGVDRESYDAESFGTGTWVNVVVRGTAPEDIETAINPVDTLTC